jgi:predicted ATPase/class 3 adenylate cyclase
MRFWFAGFELDEARFELSRGGARIPIQPKPLQLLLELLRRQPAVVTKDELLDGLWPDEAVTEFSLTRAVRAARRALGEGGGDEGVIRTVRGRGYGIGVAVEAVEDRAEPVEPIPEPSPLPGEAFVGREEALAQLHGALDEALAGRGGVVFVVGEPGIGKTRTVETFAAAAPGRGAQVLWGRSVEGDEEPAYWPWMQMLRGYAREREAEVLRREMGVGAAEIAALVPEVREKLPDLPAPPDLPPEQARFRLFDCVTTFFQRASVQLPLVLVVDDLHWADEASLRLLGFLARELGGSARLLVVGTYRDVGAPRLEPLEEVVADLAGSPHTRPTVALEGLPPAELNRLIAGATEAVARPKLVEAIYEKTRGNPFFVREIVRLLQTTGIGAEGWDSATVDGLAIPPSVRKVVSQRVGRLSKEAQGLLEAAAVIGGEAPLAVLAQVGELSEEALFEPLEEVEDAGFLAEQPGAPGTFQFAHTLVRETLYEALPRRRRVQLHRRVGVVMEKLHAARLESVLATLAHHFSRAATGGDVEKAVEYAARTAEHAMARLGFEQTVSHAARAIELLHGLPESPARSHRELSLQMLLGVALLATKGYGASEVETAFARARKLGAEVGETPQLFPVLVGLCTFYLARAEREAATELASEVLRTAQRSGERDFLHVAHALAGITAYLQGAFGEAREHLAEAVELHDPERHQSVAFVYGQDMASHAYGWGALTLWFLGHSDQALSSAERALALAEAVSHPFTLAGIQILAAALFQCRGDVEECGATGERVIATAREHGFPMWIGVGMVARGWSRAEQGELAEGLAEIREGISQFRETGMQLFSPFLLALLAEASLKAGDVEGGLSAVEEALGLVEKNLDRFYEAELHRLKGELLLAQSDPEPASAEGCFRRALELSREQGARSLELCAATSLARLWQSQGKRELARELLSEIYDWFTEGFDTRDLKRAKAVLDELSEESRGVLGRSGEDLERLAETRAPPDAERRHLTVMFCDLVGSAALSQELDPEELRDLVRGYQETCAREIERYGGHIAQYLGDGVLVYFGYPRAHGDDAERAVRAALDIVLEIEAARAPLEGGADLRLAVHIGIHTGMAVVGEVGSGDKRETLALGEAVNLAARLQEIAAPNQVVVSGVTRRLTQGFFLTEDLGTHQLKGILAGVAVHRVVRHTGIRSRLEAEPAAGLTPLVGRERELGLLMDRWEQVQEGRGQVVVLSGEAGIGKSRLIQVLRQRLADSPHTWLECRCSPYTQDSALYPVIELVQNLLALVPEDSPEEKSARLEAALGSWELQDAVPLIASLLSLPLLQGYNPPSGTPERQRRQTLDALLRWLFTVARLQPLVLLCEDLHWADPSTLELLELLFEQAPTAGILVLLSHRPEFEPIWSARSHATPIPLSRLTRRQAAEMIERIAGTPALPEPVLREIVGKTDGIPLFVEELSKSVLESGLLAKADGADLAAGPRPEFSIPETLRDSLMARLDRLSPVKEVAQLCATLGREFSYELLQAVSPLEEGELQQGLTTLVEAELLYQRGLPPSASYAFKHALIQDTAYQSLLKSRRQQFHRQIAQTLAERFPETTEKQPERVAHHYTEAGLLEAAIDYWRQAGQRAVEGSANVEAIRHLTKGLDLLPALPATPERSGQELGLRTLLGVALIATRGYGVAEVEQSFARARELCNELGETPQLFPVLEGLWLFYLVRSDPKNTPEIADQLFRLAERSGDPTLILEGHQALGITAWARGAHALAKEQLAESLALYDPERHAASAYIFGQDPGVAGQVFAGLAAYELGYPDHARGHLETALSLAERRCHPFSSAMALVLGSTIRQLRGEPDATLELASAGIALAEEQGFPLWIGTGMMMRGAAIAQLGSLDAGIEELREGLSLTRETGTRLFLPYATWMLSDACLKAGRLEEAREALDEALGLVGETLDRYREPDLHVLEGELLLASPRDPEAAEACFQRALGLARGMGARSKELIAATSLARLWQSQGKREQARDLLAEIYGWFTEGFDTRDLKQAKALLDELTS